MLGFHSDFLWDCCRGFADCFPPFTTSCNLGGKVYRSHMFVGVKFFYKIEIDRMGVLAQVKPNATQKEMVMLKLVTK